jgi:DNA-binding response OmpR family regulator
MTGNFQNPSAVVAHQPDLAQQIEEGQQKLSALAPKLFALHKYIQPTEYILETSLCTIGRSEMCQVVLPLKLVSRFHARIERDGPSYVLCDTNSVNGTFVNGRQIHEPYRLVNQDLIGLSADRAMVRFEDPDSTLLIIPRLRYYPQIMTFFLDQKPVDLTPAQFRLLCHLYSHSRSVCTRESCAKAIWGCEYDPDLDDDGLDRTISNLRRQLRKIDPMAELIETRLGLGYVLKL